MATSTQNKTSAAACLHRLLGDIHPEAIADIECAAVLCELKSGDVLFQQGDPADSLYIVVRGRLRVTVQDSGSSELKVVNEITRDQSVGEMALFTRDVRTGSVRAIRDSLLIQITRNDFEQLTQQFPAFALEFSRQVMERFSRSIRGGPARISPATNIALINTTANLDFESLREKVVQSLKKLGTVLPVKEEAITRYEGHFAQWLSEQEEQYDFVVMAGSQNDTAWVQRIINNTDKVVFVRDAANLDSLSSWLNLVPQNHQVDVIALSVHHQESSLHAHNLPPDCRHWHIRSWQPKDFDRIARLLSGRAIGLVLSGGGARSLAHIGVYQALREEGVPIDMVGGTSMGGLVGALIAMNLEPDEIVRRCKSGLVDAKPLGDYTLPFFAFMRGERLTKVCKDYFGTMDIQDLWLEYFNVSADMNTDTTIVQDKGLLWKSIRASVSLPGVVPPLIDGNFLLVDGGVVNNLPVDVMKLKGAGKIIAADIQTDTKQFYTDVDGFPSAFAMLKSKFSSNADTSIDRSLPSLFEILNKSLLMSSAQKKQENSAIADVYLAPPVGAIGLLEFARIDEMVQLGYDYARQHMSVIKASIVKVEN